MSTHPYQAPPSYVLERLQIAILCQEHLDLQWNDDTEPGRVWADRVWSSAIESRAGMAYLLGKTGTGEAVSIRIDLIRNLPRPMK
jgi:hypothetical protein